MNTPSLTLTKINSTRLHQTFCRMTRSLRFNRVKRVSKRTIQNSIYFQNALNTLTLIVAHNTSQLIHLIGLSINVNRWLTKYANLCRRNKIYQSLPVNTVPCLKIFTQKYNYLRHIEFKTEATWAQHPPVLAPSLQTQYQPNIRLPSVLPFSIQQVYLFEDKW